MEDLISKETLYKELLKLREHRIKWTMESSNELSINEIFHAIERCPIHKTPEGYWKEQEEPFGPYNEISVACCSECGESYVLGEMGIDDVIREFHFCPNCGAKMQKEEPDATTSDNTQRSISKEV